MPYRELPRFLLCPRCTEVLEPIVAGVWMCTRCEGAWLTNVTLERAFGSPRWPQGQMMWWHNELACPECALEGSATIMDAKNSNGVHLDTCPKHGLWLDRGELGRITNGGGDDLSSLFQQLDLQVDRAELSERRARWRSDQEAQRQALGEALAAHALAAEAERARESEIKREQDDAAYARTLSATAAVARLEARAAALRAELDLCKRELAKAREELAKAT